MNALDYTIVAIYLAGLLGLGFVLREQVSSKSYFLGGQNMGWFPLTLSTMATQLSAISFVSAPAFVGLRENGGMKWLTYEFGVPLAMIFVMLVITPALYRANVVSIYDFLEKKHGKSTRLLISVFFQIVRSFSTGIVIYAPALILQAVLEIPFWQSIIVVGAITLVYSALGGMKAVVYSDAAQMILIFFGLLLVGWYAIAEVGGVSRLYAQLDSARLSVIDFGASGFDGKEFGFLPMLFGGFVLYASYYGCDQTQAQRYLSARDMNDARRLLLFNGILRFPLVLVYCVVGLAVGTAMTMSPDILARIPVDKPDHMMPIFIVEYLPNGLIGLLLVAILAAAMSSVSSSMNSLAAVTIEDLKSIGFKPKSEMREVIFARRISIVWGVIILLLSSFAGSIAPTVIEAINKVGSALYGPVLGVFSLAILSRRVGAIEANIGLLTGLALNLYLWRYQPQIFWMWWNLIGLGVTVGVAYGAALLRPARAADAAISRTDTDIEMGAAFETKPYLLRNPSVGILLGAFALMLAVSLLFNLLSLHGGLG